MWSRVTRIVHIVGVLAAVSVEIITETSSNNKYGNRVNVCHNLTK
jgi:hypothetical protein